MRTIASAILLFLLTNLSLSAQDYRPMAIEDATWIMQGWGDYETIRFAYKIKGDTIINSVTYKKVYEFTLDASKKEENFILNQEFVGYIREDINDRKVYGNLIKGPHGLCASRYFQVGEEEVLLYDFNIEIGDTLQICDDHLGGKEVLKSSQELSVYNENFKVWSFNDTINHIVDQHLIEGIGSYAGLFNDYGVFITAGVGIGLEDYCVGSKWDCGLTTSTSELLELEDYSLFPNPTSGLVQLDFGKQLSGHLHVSDLSGRLYYSSQFQNLDEYTLDLDFLASGVYMIQIHTDEGRLIPQRVVVNN